MDSPLLVTLNLTPRDPKGGGGGGRGSSRGGSSSSGSSKSGSSGGGTGGSKSSTGSSSTGKGATSSGSQKASTPVVISSGQPFAGRMEGGGTRDGIYGTKTYGSGYAGTSGIGTSGLSFPYYFWPIVWPLNAGYPGYLDGREYGSATNSTRPGGPLTMANFTSLSNPKSVFYIVSDDTTIRALIDDIKQACGNSSLDLSMVPNTGIPFTNSPLPEQVIQYYRASTLALALEGYNNSATFVTNGSIPDTPLPVTVDTTLMKCLNETIGQDAFLSIGFDDNSGQKWETVLKGVIGGVVGSIVLFYVILRCRRSHNV